MLERVAPSSAIVAPTLFRQTAAGMLGGLIAFLLLEPAFDGAAWYRDSLFGGPSHVFLSGILAAAVITAALIAADDLASGDYRRALARALSGALAAGVLGAGYSVIGHAVFAVLVHLTPGGADLLPRALCWALFGLGVGLSGGITSRAMRRAYHGCLGGLGGGFLGGLAFGMAQHLTSNGALHRLSGLVLLGGCVGLATAMVDQWVAEAWLVFTGGPKEGRRMLLHQHVNIVGRDELAGVPLFGDHLIERHHAVLTLWPVPQIEERAVSTLMRVNGVLTQQARLTEGSTIQLGRHRFRIHFRTPPEPLLPGAIPHFAAKEVTSLPGNIVPMLNETRLPDAGLDEPLRVVPLPEHGLLLRVHVGAGAGNTVRLSGAQFTLGRDTANSLTIPDQKVSRQHAQILHLNGAWVLVDLGSTNGTRLNGLRILKAGLVPGDYIYVGDTVLAVEAAGPLLEDRPAEIAQANQAPT